MDRVIITGGNGFIGKHLVQKLLSCKPDSLALISNTNSTDKYLSDEKLAKSMALRFYPADIRDGKAITDIFLHEKADTCIHLAAKTSVPGSIKHPRETMDINVQGTLNVLEGCYNSQVNNFVFASSAAVYGDVTELPISEDHTLQPLSPYGTSKMLAEQHVWNYGKLKKIKNTISLRIFNVYGVDQTSASDVVTKFAKRLSMGLAPIIYGDGTHTRDFISVDDVTEAMLLSLQAMKNNYNSGLNAPPIFNIGSGTPTSITALALKMISIAGLDVSPVYQEAASGLGVILHSYADITKAEKYLRFVAKKDFGTGLGEILRSVHLVNRNHSK